MHSLGQLLGSFWSDLGEIASGGYVLAIAAICSIQYGWHVYRQTQMRRQADRFRLEKEGLEGELKVVEKERMVSRLENHILREFVAETEIDKALGLLLHHFVPSSDQGFAAFLKSPDDADVADAITRSRGLSSSSQGSFRVDRPIRERVLKEGLVAIHGAELRQCDLWRNLSRTDRDKAARLFVASVTHSDGSAFLFVTTALYPAGAALDQQIELAKRLMASVAGNLRRTYEQELQEDQYRIASDVLELRSLADRHFETPTAMLQQLVEKLGEKVHADRAALLLFGQEGTSGPMVVRAGMPLATHTLHAWHSCEETLLDAASRFTDPRELDVDALGAAGVNSHIRSALLLPLLHQGRHIGALCFSRQSESAFVRVERQLADWAAEYLAETIRRVLTHAAVEQQARQDALTELANRRIFDQQLKDAVAKAERTGGECSLLFFDIDRFKSINDTYGHPAGDEVLRRVSAVLKDQVRKHHRSDRPLAARYGGEELAVLLPGTGIEEAHTIAEAIRSAVEKCVIHHRGRTISVTLSAGVATCPGSAASAHELLTAADAALYHAKATGRNNVCCADATPV